MDARTALDVLLEGGDLLGTAEGTHLAGSQAGQAFPLTETVTKLGRHPDSEIMLDDITVSRRHAEVERTADGYIVRDAGSLNGTYVNQERVDQTLLANSDELQVGKFRLVFFELGS